MAVAKPDQKPYSKKVNKGEKSHLVPKMTQGPPIVGGLGVREKNPKCSPQSEDEIAEYTPRPEEEDPHYHDPEYPIESENAYVPFYYPRPRHKEPENTPRSEDEMVEDNFNEELEGELQINCGYVSVLSA